mgnify:CR=1 FL=1
MRFATAFTWMKRGKRVRAPGFIGYWYWDAERGEVIIVTKNNERIPMKNSDDWDFTLGFINSDEWEIYDGEEDPRRNSRPWLSSDVDSSTRLAG